MRVSTYSSANPGLVVIGRNEGDRLRRCFESIRASPGAERVRVVYVDSGSTDGSRELARSFGAAVVDLDPAKPFTAARARNAGFDCLLRATPRPEFVQFVDGDCALDPGWLAAGLEVLRARSDVAVVCGRRRERAPERSVFNRLCDVEWDTPIGDARACGGDALMRVDAFRRVGGFDPAMIAGEEPDLCLRLARAGYRIVRHDAAMTLHDAAMTHWTQWWQRAVRTGHTTAELLAKHGNAAEHRRLRRALSAVAWAVVMPLAFLASIAWSALRGHPLPFVWALFACASACIVLLLRVRRSVLRRGRTEADARAFAVSCLLAKVPETWGMLLYAGRRASGNAPAWIEYKEGPRGLASAEHARPSGASALRAATRPGAEVIE